MTEEIEYPKRITKRWLRSLTDAQLREVEAFLCGLDGTNMREATVVSAQWQRAYEELQSRAGGTHV